MALPFTEWLPEKPASVSGGPAGPSSGEGRDLVILLSEPQITMMIMMPRMLLTIMVHLRHHGNLRF